MTSHNCFHVARQTCSSNHRLVSNYSFRASCILPHLLPLRKGLRKLGALRCSCATVWNANLTPVEAEKSQMVVHEMVLFLVQLECDSQLQRALNYENFQVAQDIRNRRTEVDNALSKVKDVKEQRLNGSHISSSEKWEVGTEILRLRGELQKAVDEERYGDAAIFRDKLAAAQAQLQNGTSTREGDSTDRRYVLGQRVIHKKHGYRAVVCGWDSSCAESEEWQSNAQVQSLSRGKAQPFYQLLVDIRDWPTSSGQAIEPPVTYVAEELLDAPEDPSCWLLEHGPDNFQHPYMYLMFLGTDERGNLIPARTLRERFGQARADVFPPNPPEGEDA